MMDHADRECRNSHKQATPVFAERWEERSALRLTGSD
jgi:hypothetical protein